MSHQDDHDDCLRCFMLLCQHNRSDYTPLKMLCVCSFSCETGGENGHKDEWMVPFFKQTPSLLKWTWGRFKYLKWMRFEMRSEDTNTVNRLCQLCFVVNLCNFLADTIKAFSSYAWDRKKRLKTRWGLDLQSQDPHCSFTLSFYANALLYLLLFTFISWRQSSTNIHQKSDSRLKPWDALSIGSAF